MAYPQPEDIWMPGEEREDDEMPEVTPEYLAAVAARTNAATEGPWALEGGDVSQSCELAQKIGEHEWERQGIVLGEHIRENDAEFIAHAREDIPALLAHIHALQAKVDGVQARLAHDEDGWSVDLDDIRAALNGAAK
jgi:hypothetical protein